MPEHRTRRLVLLCAFALTAAAAAADLEQDIAAARETLDGLLEVYTEKHPDTIAARRRLEDLLARQRAAPPPAAPLTLPPAPVVRQGVVPGPASASPAATDDPAPPAVAAPRRPVARCDDGAPVSAANALCGTAQADWLARAGAAGVFYATNFDVADRAAYLALAHSHGHAQSADGKPKLDLERTITLTGNGASRHNWFASEGANEAGPSWNLSFSGPGRHDVDTRKERLYLQFSLYTDGTWVDHVHAQGDIKTLILFDPSVGPFARGEIVLNRRGWGPWPFVFFVSRAAMPLSLMWLEPGFVRGDDTLYTYFDAGPQRAGGATDLTDINLFERRRGPRRRNLDGADPDYAAVPRYRAGTWHTIELHVDVSGPRARLKLWFAEYGQPPMLLLGHDDMGFAPDAHTYRGAFLINRAENAQQWVSEDTFVIYDEVIVSDQPIAFPGGYALPHPGAEVPPGWPPHGTRLRR